MENGLLLSQPDCGIQKIFKKMNISLDIDIKTGYCWFNQ
jgi:hypothetical protein